MNEFVVSFKYEERALTALVSPNSEHGNSLYSVRLEIKKQLMKFDISARPSGDGKIEWCYSGGWDEGADFDPDLLMAIGHAIEIYQAGNN